jgi:ABC-type Fe3+-citrate transport system substrate-binding protein
MFNMKKTVNIFLMIVMLLLMFSCAKDNAGDIKKETETADYGGSLDSGGIRPALWLNIM